MNSSQDDNSTKQSPETAIKFWGAVKKNRIYLVLISLAVVVPLVVLHSMYGLHPLHLQKTLRHALHREHLTFAMCVIAKDERGIGEWVEYHKRKGCGKFYIYDNDSEIPMSIYISKYIEDGTVVYIPTKRNETLAYTSPIVYSKNHCVDNFGHLHNWMGLLDADEFIVTDDNKSIPDVLHDFEGFGGVVLNWMTFGSSGLIDSPKTVLGPHYTKCQPDFHVKPIVNPASVSFCPSSHFCRYYYPHISVNIDKEIVPQKTWHSDSVKVHKMYINHYTIKSLEDFKRKQKRGNGDDYPVRPDSYFEAVDKDMRLECSPLLMPLEFAPEG